MRPMTYTADRQKITGRFVPCVQGVLLAAILAIVGMVFRESKVFHEVAAKDTLDSFLLLAALAILTASIAAMIWFSRHLPAARNLLSVDRHGLTHMMRGRTRRWRWAELSPVRLDGRFATFTAECGRSRSEGRIDDIYPTRLAEIVARINDVRDQALAAGDAASDAEMSASGPSAPTIYHIDAATRNRQRLKE